MIGESVKRSTGCRVARVRLIYSPRVCYGSVVARAVQSATLTGCPASRAIRSGRPYGGYGRGDCRRDVWMVRDFGGTLIAPREWPVGASTALIGAPWVIVEKRSGAFRGSVRSRLYG